MNDTIINRLGEIDRLKSQLATLRPLGSEALQKIREAWEIENTYESNRIEGNTLTLQETALIVNEGITVAGKTMREHLEAINHAEAIEYIKDIAHEGIEISERTIKDIHALILRGINRREAGVYRNVPVVISGSRHVPPQPYLVEPQMEQFMATFRQMEGEQIHPVLIAAFLHDELVRIHPFIDGNGRTSRLLMNLYLLRSGYMMATLKGSDAERLQYYNALEQSHVEKHPEDFQLFVIEAERVALARYLDLMK